MAEPASAYPRAQRSSGGSARSCRAEETAREASGTGLATLGDLLLDVVVRPERPIEAGTDVPGSVRLRAGGSAANVARAYARLGGRALFIGAVGRDGLGRRLGVELQSEGVHTHLVRVAVPTGRLAALVDASGERSFVTQRGAADLLEPRHLRPGWLRGCRALHLPAYSLLSLPLADAAAAAAALAHGRGMLVSVDLSSVAPIVAARGTAWERIAGVAPAVILGTASEADALSGRGALESLLELAPIVVVKEGPAGCRVLWRGDVGAPGGAMTVAAARLEVADTTGAGDAFAAGFLQALLAGPGGRTPASLRRAAVAGHRAAASLLRRPRGELAL